MNKIDLKNGTSIEIFEDKILLRGETIRFETGEGEEETLVTKIGSTAVIQDKDSTKCYVVGSEPKTHAGTSLGAPELKVDENLATLERTLSAKPITRQSPSNQDLSLRLDSIETATNTKANQSDVSHQISQLQTLISGISATVSKLAEKVFGE
ncbi:MAG: hypothetical protein WBP82_05685 [Leuconostoc mesenteroides]